LTIPSDHIYGGHFESTKVCVTDLKFRLNITIFVDLNISYK